MRTQLPRVRLTAFVIGAVLAAGVFLYLNSTFGGPTLLPGTGATYELRASFPDSQNMVSGSLVMYRGFQIGSVESVRIVHGRAQVTFTVDPAYAPLPAGTIVQVGHRTFLQEAYVDVFPGPMRGPRLHAGATVRSVPTVEPDDALQVFDPQTRRLLQSGTAALARGLRSPGAGEQLNGTIDGLDQTIGAIRRLTGTLRGQAPQIATLVRSSATVLGAVADVQRQLVEVIGAGRVVAGTFAGQARALGRGIDGLNAVLAAAQRLLPELRPFLTRATPLLHDAARTARALQPAAVAFGPAVALLRRAQTVLPPASRAAAPFLRDALASARATLPLAAQLRPAVANLVPLLGYIASQIKGWDAFAANVSDAVSHGDSQGPWLQGFVDTTQGGLQGSVAPFSSQLGLCVNPYPGPGDARHPQPYARGHYPKLLPYFPRSGGR
jgi:virulence factor Mce-like protein